MNPRRFIVAEVNPTAGSTRYWLDGHEISEAEAHHHTAHWITHPATGALVEEANVILDGERVYWCGHTEPA